ncbi:DUF4235 domain-containing protein [Cellulomonas endophytica]|uniref:DUF4235 domain-containing protein n=1 Tax=Cellulomonas endophytica TaxID=2494735 RepID=UPI001011FC66|nr:DUF4235 domain-containing protein [Cellulomonas endophytica]
MADDERESTLAKVLGMATALGAAWVGQKVLHLVWRRATGHDLPDPATKDEDIRFGEVAIAAAITGAVAYVSRALAARGTARLVHRVNTNRPPLPKR